MQRKSGFTLVEIMIVVAIIALLAAVALPAFMRARKRAQNTRFIAAMKVAADAFQMYSFERSGYPPDVGPTQIPEGMAPYFGKFPWTQPTPIGGTWDWDFGSIGVRAAVTALQPAAAAEQCIQIDEMMDDGNPETGSLRYSGNRLYFILEE